MSDTSEAKSDGAQTSPTANSEVTVSIEPVKAGQTLDRLVIEEEIGRGGMGTVFRARHTTLDISVAVKVLSPLIVVQQPAFAERFMREAKLAARIRHPNIVAVMDAVHDDEKQLYYIVQEFVDGGSALDLLDSGSIDEDKAIDIAIGVVRALQQAEIHNIIHRDIKPANIMLTRDGEIKLADLGLARDMGDDGAGPTVSGSILGTPAYLSPEQAESVKDLDIRADIYSLGATFYHLLTGESPFHGETTMNILRKLATREIFLDPGKKKAGVTPATAAVCRKMMALNREKRYSSCAELLAALEALKRGEMPTSCQPVNPKPLPEKIKDIISRSSFNQRIAAAAGAVFVAVSLFLWLSRSPDDKQKDIIPENQPVLADLPPPEIEPTAGTSPETASVDRPQTPPEPAAPEPEPDEDPAITPVDKPVTIVEPTPEPIRPEPVITPPDRPEATIKPTPAPVRPKPATRPKTTLVIPKSPTVKTPEPTAEKTVKKIALRSIPDANDLFKSAETLRKAVNPFKKEKRYREAERLYLKILARYPQTDKKEHCYYQLGNIYESYFYGEYRKAIEQYQKILSLNPDTTYDIRWRIALLYENRLGQRDEARKWYLKSAKLSKTPATRSEARIKAEELEPDNP